MVVGGAFPADAADEGPEPLAPRRLFDQSRPGVELVTARFSGDLAVPVPEVTPANERALEARVVDRMRRGEIPTTEAAARNATIEEIARDPLRWYTATGRFDRRKVKLAASGSGFTISPDGYIVTNAHVAALKDQDLKAIFLRQWFGEGNQEFIQKLSQGGIPQSLTAKFLSAMVRWAMRTALLYNVQRRLAVVTPSGSGGGTASGGRPARLMAAIDELPGKDVAILKVDASNMATVPLGDDTALSTGDRLFVLGFPAPATFNPALSKDSQKEPTLTQGVLSAKKKVRQGFTVLQTDATMTHGNSGGPVFDEQGRVVGVATFGSVDPSTGREVAGLNFAVPVSVVSDLLSTASIEPAEGDATRNYRMALDAFDRQWYKRALPLFRKVKALDPNHPSVGRLIAASEAAIRQGRDRTPREVVGLPVGEFAAVAAAGGLVVAGALAVPLRRRRRARRRGVPVVSAFQPAPTPPSFTGVSRPASLEPGAAVEEGDWFDHRPVRAVGTTDPWPPEDRTAEPPGQPALPNGGRHERQPGRRVAWSEPTPPLVGQPVCRNCGHRSPPTLRFCEQCWTVLGSEE
ncbi:MAG TPA: serine protease [Actinomycetes bacterium]|nr:serine protease [Actinomycetes bacterium]